jgi:hypothetical protein
MRRLAVATLSFAWMAFFAFWSGLSLLAAEDGVGAAAAALGLSPEMLDGIASRPALGGFCFGAAVVAALFATVLVSALLNTQKELRQGAMIADMGFGGAFGLAVIAFLAFYLHPVHSLAAAAIVVEGLLVASFLAMRAAMAEQAGEAAGSLADARRLARHAAANVNVVRFPIERVLGVR